MNWCNREKTVAALWICALLAPGLAEAGPGEAAAIGGANARPAIKRLDVPIPVNYSAKGLRIPSRDANGKVRMFFNLGTAFRVDDGHLRMTTLQIETYDDAGNPDMKIDMTVSHLDLKTNLVSSVEPVTIHRSDFEVSGANMVFDPQTRQGKFSGPVRMLIFNHDELDNKPATKTQAVAKPQGVQP